jgi:sulfiredoxin
MSLVSTAVERTVVVRTSTARRVSARCLPTGAKTFGWDVASLKAANLKAAKQVREVPIAEIRRPLAKVRSNDQAKVDALKASILEHGLLEPIDVLEVDGVLFGFSGCHRFQAHVELGMETIWCRVRVGNKTALKMHLM